MKLGPREETREVYGRMVRTVWHQEQRYRCDVCGNEAPRSCWNDDGDYCSAACLLVNVKARLVAAVAPSPWLDPATGRELSR